MGEHCQIECYVECPGPVTALVSAYGQLLSQLTTDPLGVEELVARFPHNRVEGRFTWPAHRPTLNMRGNPSLRVEPLVLGWPCAGLSRVWQPHMEVGLLFEAERVWDDERGCYLPEVAERLWHATSAFLYAFGRPVYLTNEWNEGESWAWHSEGRGTLFAFDLGCFPRDGVHERYAPPFDYHMERLPDMDAAYRRSCFLRPPWAEPVR